MNKICRRTYNNEAISEEESWLEYDQEKEYNEMKELDRAVQEGTDIYPDTFY